MGGAPSSRTLLFWEDREGNISRPCNTQRSSFGDGTALAGLRVDPQLMPRLGTPDELKAQVFFEDNAYNFIRLILGIAVEGVYKRNLI
jgi:hypothetical protein